MIGLEERSAKRTGYSSFSLVNVQIARRDSECGSRSYCGPTDTLEQFLPQRLDVGRSRPKKQKTSLAGPPHAMDFFDRH